jgi:hypothetical protein
MIFSIALEFRPLLLLKNLFSWFYEINDTVLPHTSLASPLFLLVTQTLVVPGWGHIHLTTCVPLGTSFKSKNHTLVSLHMLIFTSAIPWLLFSTTLILFLPSYSGQVLLNLGTTLDPSVWFWCLSHQLFVASQMVAYQSIFSHKLQTLKENAMFHFSS